MKCFNDLTFDSVEPPVGISTPWICSLSSPVTKKATSIVFVDIQVSQKWHTNGALRCRRDYRKRKKNVKKIQLDLFADLAVFESGS
jgi:hypothetical protein